MASTSPNNFAFEDIAVGSVHVFERVIDADLVEKFADVSGDRNPLHMDEEYARASPFGKRIAHGMLAASFFSALVGMVCPGRRSLYLSQDLRFKNPLYIGSRVLVSGTVTAKSDAARVVTLSMAVRDDTGSTCVEGSANVKLYA